MRQEHADLCNPIRWLQENRIETIEDGAFSGLPSLDEVFVWSQCVAAPSMSLSRICPGFSLGIHSANRRRLHMWSPCWNYVVTGDCR